MIRCRVRLENRGLVFTRALRSRGDTLAWTSLSSKEELLLRPSEKSARSMNDGRTRDPLGLGYA